MILTGMLATLSLASLPLITYAHVVVTPNQANIGQELVFNVSVPNEKESAVTSVKLLIPEGATNITPTAKYGWTITTTTSSGNNPEITSIEWDGTIPVGQRQDFSFSAQAPAQASNLDWKAYQTYADGGVVHWDQTPAGSDDASGDAGPYSVTKVINDLSNTSTTSSLDFGAIGSYLIAGISLIVAIVALVKRK